MPIKFFGALLVVAACAALGFLKSAELKKRKTSIMNIRTALTALESEIVFSSYYLKHALLHIEKMCECGGIFAETADNIEEMGVAGAWRKAVSGSRKKLGLKESDAEILLGFGENLGKSAREQQSKNIKHIQALLECAQKEADEEYKKSARLYRSMGILGGIFIAVILM